MNINELRRLAQGATPHVGHACKYQDAHWLREGHVDFENADIFIASERPQEDAAFYAAANPATVIELLDHLEAAESDALEQARLNGMGSEREAALMAKLEAAEKSDAESIAMYRKARDERDALRARIEAMEQQEPPCGWWDDLIADISAIDCMYRGSPAYAHDAYWMRDRVVRMLEQRRDSTPGLNGEEK